MSYFTNETVSRRAPARISGLLIALCFASFSGTASAQDEPSTDIEPISIGHPDAPVEVTEVFKYTCAICSDFHNNLIMFPAFKADFIDTGQVRWTFRETYVSKYDLWVSMMVHCGSADRKFTRFSGVFDNFRAMLEEFSETGTTGVLYQIAADAGLSKTGLDACMNDRAGALALVDAFQSFVDGAGLGGRETLATPTFIVNGEVLVMEEYVDREALTSAIQTALAQAR